MRIKNSDIELDTSAVIRRSVKCDEIWLPYHGSLPRPLSPAEGAYIYLNVQLVQGARLVLVLKREGGKLQKYPLSASRDEVVALLDKFFRQTPGDTGLDDYWCGLWQAHYIEWEKIATQPGRFFEIFTALPEKDRDRLLFQMIGMSLHPSEALSEIF